MHVMLVRPPGARPQATMRLIDYTPPPIYSNDELASLIGFDSVSLSRAASNDLSHAFHVGSVLECPERVIAPLGGRPTDACRPLLQASTRAASRMASLLGAGLGCRTLRSSAYCTLPIGVVNAAIVESVQILQFDVVGNARNFACRNVTPNWRRLMFCRNAAL
jgi:hypothetical protein